MGPDVFASLVLSAVAFQLLAAGIACALAVLIGVFWFRGRAVGPALGAAPIALVAMVALGTALASGAGSPAPVEEATRAVANAIAGRLLLPIFAGPVVLLVLGVSVFEGARHGPRSATIGGVALLGALLTAAVVVASGMAVEAVTVFAWVRGVVYVLLGGFTLAALLGRADHATSAAAGSTGAWAFAWAVALGETSQRALVELMLFFQLPNVELAKRDAFVDKALEVVGPLTPYSSVAVGLGIAVGLCAIARSARADALGNGLASLVHVPLIAATFLVGRVSAETFAALGAALG